MLKMRYLLCCANWITAVVAGFQGRWWLTTWALFGAVTLTVWLVFYETVRR